ncbi:MAG TPA: hypothetical protein VN861_00910 [Candidatus Acidoferrales bacterium]|nr:hypothetical protein [Candidatus Acidoferrales bacterium]
MLLGVAVLFMGFQMVPTIMPTLVPPSVASASLPTAEPVPKMADAAAESGNTGASAKAMAEESTGASSEAPLKMDSIYAYDKGRQPSVVPVSVAQNSQSFSTIRIQEEDEKRYRLREPESIPARREWLALMVLEHSAAAFDAYSTRDAISRGAKEEDPIMRPFAHSPAIYAAIQVGPVLLDVLARHMQRSQYSFVRRTWWVPQSASTGVSIFSGVHNLNVVGHP